MKIIIELTLSHSIYKWLYINDVIYDSAEEIEKLVDKKSGKLLSIPSK